MGGFRKWLESGLGGVAAGSGEAGEVEAGCVEGAEGVGEVGSVHASFADGSGECGEGCGLPVHGSGEGLGGVGGLQKALGGMVPSGSLPPVGDGGE